MKVKEVEVTANITWSPAPVTPIYLAAGTAAQQLDATFNTSSALEIFSLNLTESGHGMPKVCSLPVENRYQKLVWSQGDGNNGGFIAGGFDLGQLAVYDAAKLLKGQDHPVVFSKNKHTGPVAALDVNPFQHNLLASGASESEIFIWDLNKHQTPMTPGAKSQPSEDVRCLAWNRQVQHILASTFASRCVVWDLRKNDPIIKVSDSTSRMRCKVVAWHPEVATQMCIASEDDHTPVIQIWDLRLASSPLRTLERHQRGVLGISWCDKDSDLLLSCGKDNRILCWNPNANVQGGEVLCELASSNQWSFDVSWCPRNPGVIATSSFDGKVSVYSLMGGQQQAQPTPAIADSFPGMEAMQPPNAMPGSDSLRHQDVVVQLKTAPKWLKKPCGASFGFGGKLVTFGRDENKNVFVSTVVTEPELVQRSCQLEMSLKNGNFSDFCRMKVDEDVDEDRRDVWKFIAANFGENPRLEYMDLLGFDPQKVGADAAATKQLPTASNFDMSALADDAAAFDRIEDKTLGRPFRICSDGSDSGMLTRALLTGNLPLAVELCLNQDRFADALILAAHGGPELLQTARTKYFSKRAAERCPECPLIEAVVSGDWSGVAARCHPQENWKEALVAALTYAYDDKEQFKQLCSSLGSRLVERNALREAILCYVCGRDLDKVVECWTSTRTKVDHPEARTKALQDLVEVVMLLKSAVHEEGGGCVPGGPLSVQLVEYASLLASQGALEPALTYLGDGNDDEFVSALRERLQGALRVSRRVAAKKQPTGRSSQRQQQGIALDQQRPGGWTHPAYGGGDQYMAYTGIHNPAAEVLSSPPPVPHYDHGGISTRRDSRPRNPSCESLSFQHAAAATYVPFGSQPPPPSEQQPSVNAFANVPSTAPQQPVPGGGLSVPPSSSGPGWNDPPPMALNSKPRNAAQPNVVSSVAQAPITQPLMMVPGSEPSQIPGPPTSYQPPPPPIVSQQPVMNQPHPYGDQMLPPTPAANMMYLPPANAVQPSQFPIMGDPAPMTPVTRSQPELAKPKEPIPAEHQVLQDVFDSLKARCLSAGNHPQTKRKLEDVGKKLEVLYDKLRDGSLPQPTLAGLHQIKDCIWCYDYNTCLTVVNQLVSTGSFSVLSQFIPGVKVLIQVSQQLGVYLERR